MEQKFLKYLKISSKINYVNGLKALGNRVDFHFLKKNNLEIDLFLRSLDYNFQFEKNEKTYLKKYVQFLLLDPLEYSVFERKEKQNKRKKTEKTAIAFAMDYFTKNGYTVRSVETQNLGWDLEIIKDVQTYLIEVKGLAKSFTSIFLSQNEYSKFKNYKNYKICIVSNCSSTIKYRKITILQGNDNNMLICENNKEHILKEVVSAVIFKP